MSFKVEVEKPSKFDEPGSSWLKVTHNGYQWTSVELANKSERQAVIKALQDFDRRKPRKIAALSEEKK